MPDPLFADHGARTWLFGVICADVVGWQHPGGHGRALLAEAGCAEAETATSVADGAPIAPVAA